MINESKNNALTKAFEAQATLQGSLALAQNVANNPMLQLAKTSGITRLRNFDLITYFGTSYERR